MSDGSGSTSTSGAASITFLNLGNAAGLLLAAPVVAVDADTRDNFSSQIEALGPKRVPGTKSKAVCKTVTSVNCTN